MDPIEFIIELQDQNRRSLQRISPEFIRNIVARYNLFLTLRDEHNSHLGYLLHTPPQAHCGVILTQICIAKHARKRGHGRRLINLLITRCRRYDVTKIVAMCPAHLKAATFFPHLGFIQTAHRRDRRTLTRYINHYSMAIKPNPRPQNHPRLAPTRWTGYLSRSPNGR